MDAVIRHELLAASGPPITQRSTSSGTPAPCIRSTSDCPVAGVISDGLNSTPLPASSAAIIWSLAIFAGKVAGLMTAMSPSGRWRRACRAPMAPSIRRDPARSDAAPTARSIDRVSACTSALVSQSGPASLARDQIGKALFMTTDIVRVAAQDFDAVDERQRRPRADSAPRARNFLSDFASLAFPQQGAGRWLIGMSVEGMDQV